MSGPTDRRLLADVAATIGLAAYSAVAALGFARVFAGWGFFADLLVVVVVGHGVSLVVRATRIPAVIGVALVALALAWTVVRLNYPTTFSSVFPTSETWTIARADFGLVRSQFRDAVAPVVFLGGWSLLAGIGTAIAVLLGDTFAFRAHARGEALVPAGVLFVFVGAVGMDRDRVALTLALVAAGFVAAALLRVRFARAPRTILGRARHPVWVTIPTASAAASLVVLGAWAVGPRLPGADNEALVDTHGRNGGVTEVINPLVDIRSRLVKRSATELFVVRATTPSYWRLIALADFNGTEWDLVEGSLEGTDGQLADAPPGSTVNEQRIRIKALRGELLPSAAEPVRVTSASANVRWNDESSTFVVDGELASNELFEIRSAVAHYTPQELRSATTAAPPDGVYVALPPDFPDSVRRQAEEVTAGQSTAYDRMVTLQDWFRSEFDYSTEVQQGNGTSAIEAFLRQRIGYCEQFAGTFAAMARSLGIPARVAVGFTPGLDQGDGTLSVRGKNAHAWPEVWFDGIGWVRFEPTPGRGAPGDEPYTGVAADQDDTPVGPTQGAQPGGPATPDGPVTPGSVPTSGRPPTEPVEPPSPPMGVGRIPSTMPWSLMGLGALLVVAALSAPAVVRTYRRRHPTDDTSQRLLELWSRALDAVEATGMRVDPTLTPLELARTAGPRMPVAAGALRSLATVATAAAYAPAGELEATYGTEDALTTAGPIRWCRQIERVAEDYETTMGRVRRYFTVWR